MDKIQSPLTQEEFQNLLNLLEKRERWLDQFASIGVALNAYVCKENVKKEMERVRLL